MKTDKVLCALIPKVQEIDEHELWMDLEPMSTYTRYYYEVIPLIDHPHSDLENGQKEVHYHVDTRYVGNQPNIGNNKISTNIPRITKGMYEMKYFDLIRYEDVHSSVTAPVFIKNSKLKHKCIHKGKCPHRGFNLENIEAINGVITCPLHGLKFESKSKKLINDPSIHRT